MSTTNQHSDDSSSNFPTIRIHYDPDSESSTKSSHASPTIPLDTSNEKFDLDEEFTNMTTPNKLHFTRRNSTPTGSVNVSENDLNDDIEDDFCEPDPTVPHLFQFNRSASSLSAMGRAYSNLSSQHIIITEEIEDTLSLDSNSAENDNIIKEVTKGPFPISMASTTALPHSSNPQIIKEPPTMQTLQQTNTFSDQLTVDRAENVFTIVPSSAAPKTSKLRTKLTNDNDDEAGDQFQDVETPRHLSLGGKQTVNGVQISPNQTSPLPFFADSPLSIDEYDQENQRRVAAITLHSDDMNMDADFINEKLHTKHLPDWCHCICRGYIYQSVSRRSAFQLPFDPQQYLVWVLLVVSFVLSVIVWFLSEPLPVVKITFGLAMIVSIIIIISMWIFVSCMETQAYKLSNIPTNSTDLMALDERLFQQGKKHDQERDERLHNSTTGVDPTEGHTHELAAYVPVRQTLHDYMTSSWFCCYRYSYTPTKMTKNAPALLKYSRERGIPQQKLPFWSRPYSYYMKIFGDFTTTVQYLKTTMAQEEKEAKAKKLSDQSTTPQGLNQQLSPSQLTRGESSFARNNSIVRGNSMVRGNSTVRAGSIVRANSIVRGSSVAPSINRQPYLTSNFNDTGSVLDFDNTDTQSIVSTLSVSRKQQLLVNTNQWHHETSIPTTTPTTSINNNIQNTSQQGSINASPSMGRQSLFNKSSNRQINVINGANNVSNSSATLPTMVHIIPITSTMTTNSNTSNTSNTNVNSNNTNTNTNTTNTNTTNINTNTTINNPPSNSTSKQHSTNPTLTASHPAHLEDSIESMSMDIDMPMTPITANSTRGRLQRNKSSMISSVDDHGNPINNTHNNINNNNSDTEQDVLNASTMDDDPLRVSTIQPLPNFNISNSNTRGSGYFSDDYDTNRLNNRNQTRSVSHQRQGSITNIHDGFEPLQLPSTPNRHSLASPLTPTYSHSNSYHTQRAERGSVGNNSHYDISYGTRGDEPSGVIPESISLSPSNFDKSTLSTPSRKTQQLNTKKPKRHSVFQFGIADLSPDELAHLHFKQQSQQQDDEIPIETTYHKHAVTIINHSSQPPETALENRQIPLQTGTQYYEDIIVDSQQQLVPIEPTTWWPHHLLSLFELYQLTGVYFKSNEKRRIYSNVLDKYESQRQTSYSGSMRYQRVSAAPEHVFVSVSYNHRLNSRSGVHGSIEGESGYYNDEVCIMRSEDVHTSYLNHFDNILSMPFHVGYLGNALFPALPGTETPMPLFGVGKKQSRPLQQPLTQQASQGDTHDATVVIIGQTFNSGQNNDEFRTSQYSSTASERDDGLSFVTTPANAPQEQRGRKSSLAREISFSQYTYVHARGGEEDQQQRGRSLAPLHYNATTNGVHRASVIDFQYRQQSSIITMGSESFIHDTTDVAIPISSLHNLTNNSPNLIPLPQHMSTIPLFPPQPIEPKNVTQGTRVLTYVHDNQITAQLEDNTFDYDKLPTQQRLYINTKRGPIICIDEKNHCVRHENSRGMVTASANSTIDYSFTPLVCTDCRILQDPRMLHCSICNKCQEGFDHHCPYLNTCIGERNYQVFFILVMFLVLYSLLGFIISIRSLLLAFNIDFFGDFIPQDSSGGNYYLGVIFGEAWIAYAVLSALMLCSFIASIGAFGSLFAFHCYLLITRQTTRALLNSWKAEKLEKTEKKNELKAQKDHARREAAKFRQNSSLDPARQKSIKKSSKGISLAVRWNIELEYDQATLDPFLPQPRRQTIYSADKSGVIELTTISPYSPTPLTTKK